MENSEMGVEKFSIMKMRACCLMLISWYNTQRSIQITFFPTLAKQVTWNVLSFGIGFVVYGSTGPTFISASGRFVTCTFSA
jgi:hypothetical protein